MNLRDRMRARVTEQRDQRNRKWYEIKNQDGDKAVVRIYDEIGYWGVTAEEFARELAGVTASELEVQINSPGGDVFDGIAIYNALRTHPAHVTTRVDGLAASAASVIAQAGDHRVMLQAAQMMIHEAWGLAIGPAGEMREFADLLDQQNEVIAGIYAARSGGDAAKFRDLMSKETWLTDAETVELGLADELVVPEAKTAAAATKQPVATAPPAAPPAPPEVDPSTQPSSAFDATEHLGRDWVREMFGSTALAD